MSHERRRLKLARWASPRVAAVLRQPLFMFDRGELPASLAHVAVVLETGSLARVRALFKLGARQVLLAESAWRDSNLARVAAAVFGDARVGAWLPAARMEVSWSLDTQSNGDFKCVVPSNPQASWEVLDSRMERTGIEVGECLERLAGLGVKAVLVSVDMQDDRDLDLCAGLVERFGERLWFSPLAVPQADLAEWVVFGRVTQLVLPDQAGADARAASLMAGFDAAARAAEAAA